MTTQHNGPDSGNAISGLHESQMNVATEAQPPQRISWKRHLQLESQTVEQLRQDNENLSWDADYYYQLVCRLAKDLRDHGIESETLQEVLLMGWLEEEGEEEPELTGDQIARQENVDGAIHVLLTELAGKVLEWDMSLVSAVRERIGQEFQERGIMEEMEFYPYIENASPDGDGFLAGLERYRTENSETVPTQREMESERDLRIKRGLFLYVMASLDRVAIRTACDALSDLLCDADEQMEDELLWPIFEWSDFWPQRLGAHVLGLPTDEGYTCEELLREFQQREEVDSKAKRESAT